jgi:acetoin utilization deacetylase AcuC-like enzyme
MFEEERDVLFISTHQFPFYPGTGALAERGKRAGEGSTVNLPLPAGSGDSEYAAAFDAALVPVLQRFNPDLILVSAGFDAAARDPLASMQVSTEGFARMAAVLRTIADDVCDGRMVLSLEGGYDLPALGAAVHAVVTTLAAPKVEIPAAPAPTPLARELTTLYREAHL